MYYVLAVKPHPTLPSGEPSYFFWTGKTGRSTAFTEDKSAAVKARYGTFGHAQNAAKRLFESKKFPEFCAMIPCDENKLPGHTQESALSLSFEEEDCTY